MSEKHAVEVESRPESAGVARRDEPQRPVTTLAGLSAPLRPLAAATGLLPPPPGAAGARVQRTSLPELFTAVVAPARDEAGGLIVEDDTATVTSGQLRRRDFMRELRAEVCRVADEELARAGRSAAGCPYIEQMLAYYEGRSASHLERAIRVYAPEARSARDARDYIPLVARRLGQGVARWVSTGQMPEDVPSDALAAMMGGGGLVGAIAGLFGLGSRASRASDTASGPSPAPQRAATGADRGRVDGDAVVRRLGAGQPLDGATRGRMERTLGHSFADVRIHADAEAATLSRDLAASAFTIGPHVALGAGAPRSGSAPGDALLAHELAHVLQQGTVAPHGEIPIGGATDPLEREADDVAAAAVAALHGPTVRDPAGARPAAAPVAARAGGLRLQRCPPQPQTPPPFQYAPRRVLRSETTLFGTYHIINDGVDPRARQPDDMTEAELVRTVAAWRTLLDGRGGMVITGQRAEFLALLTAEMPRSSALRTLVADIVEDEARPVPIVAGRDNALWVDKYTTNELDLRDLEFFEDSPSPGFEQVQTRGEALVHILAERRYRATHGEGTRWQDAHLDALRVGGPQSRYRHERGQHEGSTLHRDTEVDERARTITQTAPDAGGNETIWRLDASANADVNAIPYEMEYRRAGLPADQRGSIRRNMMTAQIGVNGRAARDVFVRFTGLTRMADTATVSVPGGGTATTDAPLGDVVPAGNAITAEVFRVDRTGPVLVHTITWSHPFNRATATRTVGGVRYAISLDLVRR